MTQEEHLSEQRQALNAALDKRDLETMRSFLHPAYVGKGKDGSSIDFAAIVQYAAQMLSLVKDFDSQVVVEDVNVSGDSAKLVVRRTERGRIHNAKVFWGLLAVALFTAVNAAVQIVTQRLEILGAVGLVVTFLAMIWLAFYLGRRSFQKVVRAAGTWQRVDGRWLLVQEQQL